MKRTLYILIGWLCILPFGVVGQNYNQAESFVFSFHEGSDLMTEGYGDNDNELQRLDDKIPAFKNSIIRDQFHFLIISHVDPSDYANPQVTNEASMRGGRLRAYINLSFDIPYEHFAFYIDRSGNFRDQVHVYLVRSPLPWFANLDISYNDPRYPDAVDEAIKRYGVVPYADLHSRTKEGDTERQTYTITDALFDKSELEDYRLSLVEFSTTQQHQSATTSQTTAQQEQTAKGKNGKKTTSSTPKTTTKSTKSASVGSNPQAQPYNLAVKTNLIPWFTVAPSINFGDDGTQLYTGAIMPNIELEYYFMNRYSVALSAMYGDFSYGGNSSSKWAVSGISIEPRYWLFSNNDFRSLYVGAFGQYGDFDIRGDKVDLTLEDDPTLLYGRTGKVMTAGASVGYIYPIWKGFYVEGSLQAGFRSISNGIFYRRDWSEEFNQYLNYQERTFKSTGFMVGLKLNLVYRFGFQ
ncbi:DUF3575 domain-containing protein [Parabacteroides sp. PF5-9]|uniref:DUF3575 domain-containing protein n=1 Tax=Parabacteroides sp. PF5-9 TaxID=1742404 RepID=UPI002473C3EB|nr:DUF3575 domain-containing protein [Parabacteroides sp. PF5-9]MDH6358623.1 hypothetical protein [Parabacteroides sp. PF5-9]